MASADDELMSLEEALRHIMTVKGCSRRAARRELASAIAKNRISPLDSDRSPLQEKDAFVRFLREEHLN
jgi:hypothetical protein